MTSSELLPPATAEGTLTSEGRASQPWLKLLKYSLLTISFIPTKSSLFLNVTPIPSTTTKKPDRLRNHILNSPESWGFRGTKQYEIQRKTIPSRRPGTWALALLCQIREEEMLVPPMQVRKIQPNTSVTRWRLSEGQRENTGSWDRQTQGALTPTCGSASKDHHQIDAPRKDRRRGRRPGRAALSPGDRAPFWVLEEESRPQSAPGPTWRPRAAGQGGIRKCPLCLGEEQEKVPAQDSTPRPWEDPITVRGRDSNHEMHAHRTELKPRPKCKRKKKTLPSTRWNSSEKWGTRAWRHIFLRRRCREEGKSSEWSKSTEQSLPAPRSPV